MDSIKFVPQSQKNLEQLEDSKSKSNGIGLIYILIILFTIYSGVTSGAYWFFVVQEQNRVTKTIQDLDNVNQTYYIDTNLEQGLFNISDLIQQAYDPTAAIKAIESVYVLNSRVTALSYNKNTKKINISMTVASINDVTKQISNFNQLSSVVSNASFSSVNADNENRGFSFVVEISLK